MNVVQVQPGTHQHHCVFGNFAPQGVGGDLGFAADGLKHVLGAAAFKTNDTFPLERWYEAIS